MYIADLASGSWVAQSDAARRLGRIRSQKAVAPLVRLLREGPSPVQNEASRFAQTFMKVMEKSWTVASLLSAFQAEPERRETAQLLSLTKSFLNADTHVRAMALDALKEIGTESPRAISAVAESANDASAAVRMFSAIAMGRLRSMPERTVPALAALLGDPSEPVRRNAVIALREYGAAGRSALPALRKAMEDSSSAVQRSARKAVEHIEQSEKIERVERGGR